MSGRPVKIAAYWSLPEAEFARARLAFEGIASGLGNVALVSWFWHYGNAVGGVTLHVRESDAERAQQVLRSRPVQATEPGTAWACPQCGQRVEGAWETCWNCGTWVDGTQTPPNGQEDRIKRATHWVEGADGADLVTVAVLALAMTMVSTGNLYAATAAWAMFVVSVAWYRAVRRTGPQPAGADVRGTEAPEPLPDAAQQSRERRVRMGEAIALRAWRASVFGLLAFPPLLVYSFWLLCRLDRKKTPLGWSGRWHRQGAWTATLTGMGLLGCALAAFLCSDVVDQALRAHFEFLFDRLPAR